MCSEIVEAAGGIVMRRAMILLVHRIGKGWELPKGRREPGESLEDTALREVQEETGYNCSFAHDVHLNALALPFPPITYANAKGQQKRVQFWNMSVESIAVGLPPDRSIDGILWCKPSEAVMRLRHDHERELIKNHFLGDG